MPRLTSWRVQTSSPMAASTVCRSCSKRAIWSVSIEFLPFFDALVLLKGLDYLKYLSNHAGIVKSQFQVKRLVFGALQLKRQRLGWKNVKNAQIASDCFALPRS